MDSTFSYQDVINYLEAHGFCLRESALKKCSAQIPERIAHELRNISRNLLSIAVILALQSPDPQVQIVGKRLKRSVLRTSGYKPNKPITTNTDHPQTDREV